MCRFIVNERPRRADQLTVNGNLIDLSERRQLHGLTQPQDPARLPAPVVEIRPGLLRPIIPTPRSAQSTVPVAPPSASPKSTNKVQSNGLVPPANRSGRPASRLPLRLSRPRPVRPTLRSQLRPPDRRTHALRPMHQPATQRLGRGPPRRQQGREVRPPRVSRSRVINLLLLQPNNLQVQPELKKRPPDKPNRQSPD